MSAMRLLYAALAIILARLKCTPAVNLAMPKPETVWLPVPYDLLENVRWLMGGPDKMHSTCGTFDVYKGDVRRIYGRWYTIYLSNMPTEKSYCSQFFNVKPPCGCFGIDFTPELGEGLISFVMFTSNTNENSVTYEIVTASLIGRNQLIFNQLSLRSFVVHPNATIFGKTGYLVPSGAVVDTDQFQSYIILLLCKEGGSKPIIMVLANALPMADDIIAKVYKYLHDNGLDTKLVNVYDQDCHYARNIVGLYNNDD